MKEERNVIELNAIVVFDGDVYASKLNEFFDDLEDFQGDIIINGDLIIDGEDLVIECNNLYVMGKINGNVRICLYGNLYVENSIDCADINVNGCISCMASIDSYNINVAEDIYVKGGIFTNGYDINVGGDFICENEVEAADIVVLNKMHVTDRVEADSISVG